MVNIAKTGPLFGRKKGRDLKPFVEGTIGETENLPFLPLFGGKPRGQLFSGFSLIELLVVLSILSLLAVLILAVFQKVREASYSTVCLGNLKQMGSAIGLYREDWDDLFPLAVDFVDAFSPEGWRHHPFIPDAYQQVNSLTNHRRFLPVVLRSYLPVHPKPFLKLGPKFQRASSPLTSETWRCPADNGLNFVVFYTILGGAPTSHLTAYEVYGMSYGYRTELGLLQKPVTSLREPSKINVVMDAGGYWHPRYRRGPRQEGDPGDFPRWSFNVLFADGRAKNITSTEYFHAWGHTLEDRSPFEGD